MLATRDARELTLKTLVGGEADGGGDDSGGETDHDDDARGSTSRPYRCRRWRW